MPLEDQFRNLIAAGFEPRAMDRYPGYLVVVKNGFVALLKADENGLALFSSPGRLVNNQIGLLIESGGRKVFQAKENSEEATPELLFQFALFQDELHEALMAGSRI